MGTVENDQVGQKCIKQAAPGYVPGACALYYVCNGVKRDEAMDTNERKKQAAIRYKDFIAPGFLMFLVEEAGHALPSWMTKLFMGKSTMNGELYLGERLDDLV